MAFLGWENTPKCTFSGSNFNPMNYTTHGQETQKFQRSLLVLFCQWQNIPQWAFWCTICCPCAETLSYTSQTTSPGQWSMVCGTCFYVSVRGCESSVLIDGFTSDISGRRFGAVILMDQGSVETTRWTSQLAVPDCVGIPSVLVRGGT